MNDRTLPGPLLSVDELLEKSGTDDLRLVDGSWHLPPAGRDAASEFVDVHLPGAVFFDIDRHAAASALPHMLPGTAAFAAAAGSLGISASDDIVVYDTVGLFSAARVRWMFRLYGAQRVSILDGGLPAWLAAGGAVESGTPQPAAAVFDARPPGLASVATADDVLAAVTGATTAADQTPVVIDARAADRFSGVMPEPRPGLRSGHIPHSVNLPFTELLQDGHLKPVADLHALFVARGVDVSQLAVEQKANPTAAVSTPVITSCGSGVTAAVISLALECLGLENVALYDGSWSEWGGRDELPLAKG